METVDIIEEAILEFISENYGETKEDACYDVESLSAAIAAKLS